MIHTFASYYCKLGGRMHFRYYHFICSILEKEIYASILEDFLECREKIAISNDISIPSEIIWKVVKMVLYDNPRIFYVSIRDSCVTRTSLSIILEPKYTFPLSSIVELNDWLNEQIGEICAPVVSSDDDFAKEIFIHNYMIQNIKYSKANVSQIANAYTIIGALLENYCVCAGVSLTFKLLMDFLDVPCIVAFGETINQSNNNGPHAWNIVNIEGDYYQLDVTWDLLEDQNSRIIKYDYFNLTSYEMYKSRIPEYKYPDCQLDDVSKLYNFPSYVFVILQYAYSLRCELFHGNKAAPIFSFYNDRSIGELKVVNYFLDSYLSNEIPLLFTTNYYDSMHNDVVALMNIIAATNSNPNPYTTFIKNNS